MESEQIVKKPRKPRVKKEFIEGKAEEQPPKRNIVKRLNKKPVEE